MAPSPGPMLLSAVSAAEKETSKPYRSIERIFHNDIVEILAHEQSVDGNVPVLKIIEYRHPIDVFAVQQRLEGVLLLGIHLGLFADLVYHIVVAEEGVVHGNDIGGYDEFTFPRVGAARHNGLNGKFDIRNTLYEQYRPDQSAPSSAGY